MKAVLRNLTVGIGCGAGMLLSGQEASSVQPRAAASAYESQASTPQSRLGAELLPRNQVASFFTPLQDQYYVVEVAVYPLGRSVHLKRGNFRLRTDGKTVKAQNPHAIATFLTQTAPPKPGMETTSRRSESVGIRRETGRPTEVFRERRAGVGVSSGHYWTSEDRETMYRELSSLELPEDATEHSVAGYLYFSTKNKRLAETIQLIYHQGGESIVLRLR